MNIAIYTLTSELHDEKSVEAVTREFLGSLGFEYDFKGNDYGDFGSHALDLIYVRTGGTEGIFRQLLPLIDGSRKFFLLTSGKSNSLAASMEILSFLKQNGMQGEILHGSSDYIAHRIMTLSRVAEARKKLEGQRLGIIGRPSDWLISSSYDADCIRQRLGIELVELPIEPLTHLQMPTDIKAGAEAIYKALRDMVQANRLDGFTLRCFDLLTTLHNTGCLALARLNAEGIVAGCEGDVPAMLSMAIVRALTGVSGFQANPARIDPETGEIVMAHCTIPLDMVERYETDTHYESGIGIGIRGYMKPGAVTLFKVSGDLSRHFVAEGQLTTNLQQPDLCRTQQMICLDDKTQTNYFLTNPIGNHHIVAPGHIGEMLEELLG